VHFALALSRRLDAANSSIGVAVLHPGVVATGIGNKGRRASLFVVVV
jgi:hypothetical protein